MEKQTQPRANLLQGTLDMLILRTLLHGSAHGHQIASIFSGPRTTFCKCSMAHSIPHCTG
jgi:hypothetical protein